MLPKFKVFIPSKGRANSVTTHKLFNDPVIVVPESEIKDYRRNHKNVIGVPDTVRGITPTRNWILDNLDAENMIQVDDDAKSFKCHELDEVKTITEPDHIEHIIGNMFLIAQEWGAYCFGFNLTDDPKHYRMYSPFSTLSVIGANIIGIRKNDIRFDARLVVKEDYDYSMQHLHKYHKVLRFNKYAIDVVHLTNPGVCVSYRSMDTEEKAYRLLVKKWGNGIVKRCNNINYLTMSPPLSGI